jgi:hypothetical protein
MILGGQRAPGGLVVRRWGRSRSGVAL